MKFYPLILCLIFPLYAHGANVVEQVGAGIADVATDIGTAVKDTGEAVVDATSDSAITTQVKTKLALESDIPSLDISVSTVDGIVYLNGKVETTLQADRVVELAQSVYGVKDVDASKLQIANSKSYLSDAMITAKVKGKIAQLAADQKISNNYDLSVETTDGNVHIFGHVSNYQDIGTIKVAASELQDVKDVNVNIDVNGE